MTKNGSRRISSSILLAMLALASAACNEAPQDHSEEIARATRHAESAALRAEAATKRAEAKVAVIENGPPDAAIANPPVAEDRLESGDDDAQDGYN